MVARFQMKVLRFALSAILTVYRNSKPKTQNLKPSPDANGHTPSDCATPPNAER
jgi:hypothetical protein